MLLLLYYPLLIQKGGERCSANPSPQYNVKTQLPKIAISVLWELTKGICINKNPKTF